jgi:hypothetical protein
MERPPHRYRHAGHAVVVTFVGLGLAALLNAQGLRKRAEIQPHGFGREVALAVTKPLARASHDLLLDRPRRGLKDALGRGRDDEIDTRVLIGPAAPSEPPAAPARPRASATASAPRARPAARRRPPPRHALAPPKPSFSRSHPLRVWVAGDSLVAVPGQSLERAVGSDGPVDVLGVESRVATGLGRPEIYNWFTRFRSVIDGLHPRAVVLSFGSNDGHDYMSGVPAGRTIGRLGSPSWMAEYRRRVAGVTEEFARAGAYVVWIGLPIPRGNGRREGFVDVNRILRTVAAAHPRRATFIDTWSMLEDRHGRYADYLRNAAGRLVRMRAPDGVHYAPSAGDLIAHTVLRRLGARFALHFR